jgi:hypothetical protein
MPDEKKDHDLDADILQGKADILKALRAAGKTVGSDSDALTQQSPPSLSSQEPEDEEILEIPEGESSDDDGVRIIPFEESVQNSELPSMDAGGNSDVDIMGLERLNRQLNDRAATLLEENTRLRIL